MEGRYNLFRSSETQLTSIHMSFFILPMVQNFAIVMFVNLAPCIYFTREPNLKYLHYPYWVQNHLMINLI